MKKKTSTITFYAKVNINMIKVCLKEPRIDVDISTDLTETPFPVTDANVNELKYLVQFLITNRQKYLGYQIFIGGSYAFTL